jgi:hypothetical protein
MNRSIVHEAVTFLVGLIMFLGGAAAFGYEIAHAGGMVITCVCVGILVFGAILLTPDGATTTLNIANIYIGRYWPGGRRADDPPAGPTP